MEQELGRRRELGDFLRAQRARLEPATIGLPAGTRRRTPGLRREELAQLCGMSPTWYSWIEQGRPVSVSPAALARLAASLRLAPAERAYLFELAGKRDPVEAEPGEGMPPAALVQSIRAMPMPAYLLDRGWNAVAWNGPAERLFLGWLDRPDGDRNLLRYIFTAPAARRLIRDWEQRARRALAEFRAEAGAAIQLPGMQRLVAALTEASPLFARAWREHEVLGREGGARHFQHPQGGRLAFEQVSLAVIGRPDLKLVLLAPSTGF